MLLCQAALGCAAEGAGFWWEHGPGRAGMTLNLLHVTAFDAASGPCTHSSAAGGVLFSAPGVSLAAPECLSVPGLCSPQVSI